MALHEMRLRLRVHGAPDVDPNALLDRLHAAVTEAVIVLEGSRTAMGAEELPEDVLMDIAAAKCSQEAADR